MLFFVCSVVSESGMTGHNFALKFDQAALWTAPAAGDTVELCYLDGKEAHTITGSVSRVFRSYGVHPAHKVIAYVDVADVNTVNAGIGRVSGTVGRIIEYDSLWSDY